MTDKNDLIQSVKNLSVNVDDLLNDVQDLEDEHQHGTWECGDCEELVDEEFSNKVKDMDVNDLMDMNYDLWMEVGQIALDEHAKQHFKTTIAIQELAELVNGLHDVVELTDTQDVVNAITLILETLYGANLKADEPDLIEEALKVDTNNKCSCGVDHSLSNYESTDNGSMY